ncbi:MAG: AGE family epimerase/isomerase [Casimicrobiaceae bacterium]
MTGPLTPLPPARADDATPGPWLHEVVMPWWRENIVDRRGGFFEALAADGTVNTDSRRTTLTQARLTYVFSHDAILTGRATSLDAAAHGLRFLTQHCRDGMSGGWLRGVDANGAVLDPVCDAYDHAFVLFALAWHFRATGDGACKTLAASTCAFMDTHLADPIHGGFVEEVGSGPKPPARHRRQNPHMHLLEAYLAWHVADPAGPWLTRAMAMFELFEQRFRDPINGTLIEFFTHDWTPAPGADGELREPGHHFEWTWLLGQLQQCTGRADVADHATRLWEFGLRFGVERDTPPLDLAFDGVTADGTLVAATKLLWPQTELIKACTARFEFAADAQARALAWTSYQQMRRHYFDPSGVRWVNQLARDGTVSQPVSPARILYHVYLAVAELDRVFA